jgi:hypothetical protein
MKILQDETQLSTIPPLDLEKSRYITPEALKQRLTQHEESRDSIERGYTVLDGPWLYRIRKSNQVQKATYQKVGDEASYHRMLDTLNEANKKDPTTESALVLVHVSTVVLTTGLSSCKADRIRQWTKPSWSNGTRKHDRRKSTRKNGRRVLRACSGVMELRKILESLTWRG